jgi:hypothetical protein
VNIIESYIINKKNQHFLILNGTRLPHCFSLYFAISHYTSLFLIIPYLTGQEDFNRLVIDGSVLSTPEVLAAAHVSMAELASRDGNYYY